MSSQRGLDGDLRRLKVACLAHHDAIGILPQKRAQDTCKRQADRFVHGHLHDSFQIVFNRFLHGEQFRIDRVNLAQAGIKRRRFSRTGRPGRDENAVRAIDQFEEKIVDVIRHAERAEIEVHDRAIKHAQHEAFAKLGR